MAGIDDTEGPSLPSGLPAVVDAHVHLFPPAIFEAIWRWFDTHGWPIRYQLHAEAVLDFLLDRGLSQIVALQYAHKPGIARWMNQWMVNLIAERPEVTGFATLFPGETGAKDILDQAFSAGLAGVKLHCHVQCVPIDDPCMHEVFETCTAWDRPLVIHAGREPKSPAYACDPYVICSADRVDRVLSDHPGVRLCVPHLGADEFKAYEKLLERHEHLYLDSTMMLADYFPGLEDRAWRLVSCRPKRIVYGSDFPNLPYAWDREIVRMRDRWGESETLEGLLGKNARRLLRLPDLSKHGTA